MNEKCKCYDDMLEKVRAKMHEKGSVPSDSIDIDFRWKDRGYMLSGGDYSPVAPQVEFTFRLAKKGGGYRDNKTKKTISVYGDYCTFCGRKYKKSED